MDPLWWVLIGVLAYWLVASSLSAAGSLPSWVHVRGPITTLHTQRGKVLLDRLARWKRFWRAWANFGLGVALIVMAGTFLLLVFQAVSVVQNPPQPTQVNRPQNVLVIPGVNEFLPLSVAPEILLGLLLGLIVHEGGHGLLSRVEDIRISSMGMVLFTLLPIGAFVEPDEDDRRRTDRGGQSRMFAAGVTNNFALTVIAFALLFGPVVGSIGVAPGAAVANAYGGSAAGQAGLDAGDRIVAVNDQTVESNPDLERVLSEVPDRTVTATLASGETLTIERSLLVTGVVGGSPLAGAAQVNETIVAVNGTAVHTEPSLRAALAEREVATLALHNRTTGETERVTAPVGAFVEVIPDGPAAGAGMPAGETAVITRVDGERTPDGTALGAVLDRTDPGQRVNVTAYVDGERRSFDVTLGRNEREGTGFLGIQPYPGVSGVQVSDFGTRLYPADTFLQLLGKGGGSFLGLLGSALVLPFASLIQPGLGFNFAGFVGWNAGFYEVTGPLSVFGGWTLVLANVLFWTGWVNFNLGLFNCVPAYPLDGGHLLRMSAEAVVSRLPGDPGREAVRVVTTSIGLLMLVSLVLMVFGPQLLN